MKNLKTHLLIFFSLTSMLCLSCDSSLKKQYEAERMLFKAGKLYQRVTINPRIARPQDYQQAIDAYENILETYAGSTGNQTIENVKKQSLLTIAELWLLQGEMQNASEVYDKFLEMYPDDKALATFVHFANAQSNERLFNLDKAISEYQNVMTNYGDLQDPLKPNPSLLNLPLKVARLKRSNTPANGVRGNYSEALQYYDSIIEQHPNSPAAFLASYYKSSIYADQQDWRKVLSILNQLVRDYPDRKEVPSLLLSMGNIYLDGLNDVATASRFYDKLMERYPDHQIAAFVEFSQARVLLMRNRYEEARTSLEEILEKYPDNRGVCASAQLAIGYSYETQGDWDRALVEYRWTQENYPLSPQGFFVPIYIAEHYRQRGESDLAEAAFNDAIEHYRNLIKKYPKTVLAGKAQEHIIRCLVAQEKWDEAADAAGSLKQVNPSSRTEINSYLLLGQIYERKDDRKQAMEVYEQFAREFPNHPVISQVKERINTLRR